MRTLETAKWRLVVPDGVLPRLVGPPPELTEMAIARGWFEGDEPTTIIVGTRSRSGRTLRSEIRRLGEAFTEPAGDGEPVDITGAHGARRADGLYEIEEGVSLDGIERMTIVVAAGRRELVTLTIRTRVVDGLAPHVQQVIDDFVVLDL